MALAICAGCMLVKRYPLKHTLFTLFIVALLLIPTCAAQQALPFSRSICKISVFQYYKRGLEPQQEKKIAGKRFFYFYFRVFKLKFHEKMKF